MILERVLMMTSYNQYESKRTFAEGLGKSLSKRGVEVEYLDVSDRALTKQVYSQIKLYAPDLIITFNAFQSTLNGNLPPDYLQIPCLFVALDPIIYYTDMFGSRFTRISTVDKNDLEVSRLNGYEKIFFWPHATDASLVPGSNDEYDVVFLGTFTDFEAIRMKWNLELPQDQCKVLDSAAEKVLSTEKTTLLDALTIAFSESKLDPSRTDFRMLFKYLDHYTRGKDRYELIKAIQDVPVHVFGETSWLNPHEYVGWEKYLGHKKNLTIHEAVPFNESLKILQKSKICLNSNPFFKNGSHERIFNGLAAGCLPITMKNLYVDETFEIGKELDVYRSGHWNDVNTTIQKYLSNDELRKNIVNNGREKVMRDHTWDTRVEELFKSLC